MLVNGLILIKLIDGKKAKDIKNMIWKKKPEDSNWILNIMEHKDDIKSIYSEFEEESILNYLYDYIQDDYKFALDVGACRSYGSNIKWISEKMKWNTLLFDAFSREKDIIEEFMTKENVNDILEKYKCPKKLEVMSIDIDGADYWILEEVLKNKFIPNIIIFEFNPIFDHTESYSKIYVEPSEKQGAFSLETGGADCSSWYGAGIKAFQTLGNRFGYELVYVSRNSSKSRVSQGKNQNNGFLLHNKFIQESDIIPNISDLHSEPTSQIVVKGPGNRRVWNSTDPADIKKQMIDGNFIVEV